MTVLPAESPLPELADDGSSVHGSREGFSFLPSVSPAADDPASAPLSSASPLASPEFLAIPGGRSPHLTTPVSPSYPSPSRQHRRTPSQQRLIRETLDAVSDVADDDDDGPCYRKINQYTIKEDIGRGSFGEVNLATDQYGKEYAVKQFSKLLLRRRAQKHMMKRGPFRSARNPGPSGLGPAAARLEREDQAEKQDALHFIREEIAVMKKLNHPNLVELIEVLDDPEHDTLYMVMEMCKKGAIMSVDVDKTATPYDEHTCRLFFRDLILGIEYLHAQNIVHRDIKPANLFVTEDDVLKIGDFGVSEIFEMPQRMRTSKSAGSPAFQPPELCVVNHGDVDGPACDIWAMGITLFCLRYGKIPFYADALAIYSSIRNDPVELPPDEDEQFVDLINKLLEKDPVRRITMAELRDHPWVTLNGTDPLLSAEENCSELIEPPNALELNHAFTRNMGHLLCVMKAIGKFKGLLQSRSRHSSMAGPAFSRETAYLKAQASPASGLSETVIPIEDQVKLLLEERRKNSLRVAGLQRPAPPSPRTDVQNTGTGTLSSDREGGAGTSHGPTPLIIGIGTGGGADFEHDEHDEQQGTDDIVSESPTSADFDVYRSAFKMEMERIQSQGNSSTVYMNSIMERSGGSQDYGTARPSRTSRGPSLTSIVAQAMENSKS